jgi:hypothetical protein
MAVNILTRFTAAASLAVVMLTAGVGHAQVRSNWIGAPGVEEAWDEGDLGGGEGSNWVVGNPPENFQPSASFGEHGSISNGGIAVIDHPIAISPAGIRLAEDANSTGTLVIRNGGSINAQVGGGGDGLIVNGANGSGTGRLVLRDNIGATSAAGYTQNGLSTLVAQLNSNSPASSFVNPLQIGGAIALNGTLRLERPTGSAFVAAAGSSWTIMQGGPITGNFSNIEFDPAIVSNAGQVFSVSTAGNAVTVSVAQRLILQVDRFTGATTLRNPTGHATNIDLINYTISSTNTPLDSSDARWKSFTDDGSKPGWFEANPTANNLSELNPQGMLTMTPGNTHNFGTPFTANTGAALGTSRVNTAGASFRYQLPNGDLVNGLVETVGRFNDLVLVVNPTNGSAIFQNQSGTSMDVISYTISSGSGALLTSWGGLSGGGEPDWFKANPTVNNLSELKASGVLSMGIGAEKNVGSIWNIDGERDLTLAYQLANGDLVPGTVFFGAKANVPAGLVGDYNGNGKVDAADYTVWRNTLGSNVPNGTGADGSGNGVVDPADYNTWKSNFGMMLGSGGGSLAGTAAVPEPATCWLMLFCAITALARRASRW